MKYRRKKRSQKLRRKKQIIAQMCMSITKVNNVGHQVVPVHLARAQVPTLNSEHENIKMILYERKVPETRLVAHIKLTQAVLTKNSQSRSEPAHRIQRRRITPSSARRLNDTLKRRSASCDASVSEGSSKHGFQSWAAG